MKDNNLHIPRLLNWATYIGVTAMSLLGISRIASFQLQLIAFGLCLLSGLIYHLYFTKNSFWLNHKLFFGLQTFILTLVFLIDSRATDAFNFLFLLLAIHTAVVLPPRLATAWIALYYIIVNSIVLFVNGMDGFYSFLFYLITYCICVFFGYTLQQAETARAHNQKLIEELQETQQKLHELAIVEERNRLARDLHDSVKQQVFAISMQLSAARTALSESNSAYQPIIDAEKLAQQASIELKNLIHQLRPPSLDGKKFETGLRDYVMDWSGRNNIEVKLSIADDLLLSMNEEQAFFRVIQEALSNIARHSQATLVGVELIKIDNEISLCISDKGKGFDVNQMQMGIGLNSMRERLAQISGTFQIYSEVNFGTQITAKLRRL